MSAAESFDWDLLAERLVAESGDLPDAEGPGLVAIADRMLAAFRHTVNQHHDQALAAATHRIADLEASNATLTEALLSCAQAEKVARRRHPSAPRPIPRDEWYDQVTGES